MLFQYTINPDLYSSLIKALISFFIWTIQGIVRLTSADSNHPAQNNEGIALRLLPDGAISQFDPLAKKASAFLRSIAQFMVAGSRYASSCIRFPVRCGKQCKFQVAHFLGGI